MATASAIWIMVLATGFAPDDTVLRVDAGRVLHRVSPLLYGACIEDVNHEIHGGIDSQMIFGESFAEPPTSPPIRGFRAFGGRWEANGGEVRAEPGPGPKLVADGPNMASGEVGVEVRFDERRDGNSGLILNVGNPRVGADAFTAYEISLETTNRLVIGRHRRNWEPMRVVPVDVPTGRWIALTVRFAPGTFEVFVDGRRLATIEDRDHPLAPGRAGVRVWQRPARFRNFHVANGNHFPATLPFEAEQPDGFGSGVSGMWAALRRGSARGEFSVESDRPFSGSQAQRLRFVEGEGEVGIENRGLNRWGMNLVPGATYEGYLYARADEDAPVAVALETGDGSRVLASSAVTFPKGTAWNRRNFKLTVPATSEGDKAGRFAIKLTKPGSVDLGYAFLQAGDWGRFRGLPDRKDVVDGLIAQGVNVLRYGGSMVNHPGYRWKKMIGPREARPPGPGTWYPYSSNGWGIIDFLNLCEGMSIPGIPDFNMDETPRDMADFVEYANGPADSRWGRKRAEDGHPEPYRLKHIQLGNEEAVDETYYARFRPIAEAIWAKDPAMILVVGDFAYHQVIRDPDRFAGASSKIGTLAAHRKILELAKARDREVWFDIHVTTNQPPEPHGLRPELSYIDQVARMVPGARTKVVFFEYNSGNHAQRRALSNALASNEAERIGDLMPIACVANCLQPDGQNDNDWDQGMLFLNPSSTWLQPPGYVIQMARRHYQPLLVGSDLSGPVDKLSINAKRSDDGKTLVLQVINWDDRPRPVQVEVAGFAPTKPEGEVEQLAGAPNEANTATEPNRIRPTRSSWRHDLAKGPSSFTFAPRSFTLIRLD